MDATGVGFLAALACAIGLLIAWWRWQQSRLDKAKRWPQSEATIESGEVEVYASFGGVHEHVKFPVFAFSYQVKEKYYSGRFTLRPYIVEYDEAIVSRMVGRKMPVCYDPHNPERCVIPDEMIEGYKVEQKMEPHLFRFYPSD